MLCAGLLRFQFFFIGILCNFRHFKRHIFTYNQQQNPLVRSKKENSHCQCSLHLDDINAHQNWQYCILQNVKFGFVRHKMRSICVDMLNMRLRKSFPFKWIDKVYIKIVNMHAFCTVVDTVLRCRTSSSLSHQLYLRCLLKFQVFVQSQWVSACVFVCDWKSDKIKKKQLSIKEKEQTLKLSFWVMKLLCVSHFLFVSLSEFVWAAIWWFVFIFCMLYLLLINREILHLRAALFRLI